MFLVSVNEVKDRKLRFIDPGRALKSLYSEIICKTIVLVMEYAFDIELKFGFSLLNV